MEPVENVVSSLCGTLLAILTGFLPLTPTSEPADSVELMMESPVSCACNTDRGMSPEVDLSGFGVVEVLVVAASASVMGQGEADVVDCFPKALGYV